MARELQFRRNAGTPGRRVTALPARLGSCYFRPDARLRDDVVAVHRAADTVLPIDGGSSMGVEVSVADLTKSFGSQNI
ncbi:hypothetical protein, partial [Gordonia sp. HS-NH1]|uniref:hypothetical protein n=1 Tax=Gordonia sp. HS-NH1 TaxID=1435068 RepID=UPI001E621DA5